MRIISGEARGKPLVAPAGHSTRPPLDWIRKSLFSILEGRFEGRRVLDLFAGSGAFGLEAVSRGAARAVLVERDPAALTALRRNVISLGFQCRCDVVRDNALTYPDLSRPRREDFALVFLDPPFKMFHDESKAARVFDRVEELLGGPALEPDALVVLRRPRRAATSCPLTATVQRVYGESVIHLFENDTRGGS